MKIFGINITDSVDSVLTDFQKAVDRLKKVQQHQEMVVQAKEIEIKQLEVQKGLAKAEADRAGSVASKIESLIS